MFAENILGIYWFTRGLIFFIVCLKKKSPFVLSEAVPSSSTESHNPHWQNQENFY